MHMIEPTDHGTYKILMLPPTRQDFANVIQYLIDRSMNADYSQGYDEGSQVGYQKGVEATQAKLAEAKAAGYLAGRNAGLSEAINKMSEIEPARPIVKVISNDEPIEQLTEMVHSLKVAIKKMPKSDPYVDPTSLEIARNKDGYITGFVEKGTVEPEKPYTQEKLADGGELFVGKGDE